MILKATFICGKCGKETLSFDPDDSIAAILKFDFKESAITFLCPHCQFNNILHLGNIQKALDKKTALPSLGLTRF